MTSESSLYTKLVGNVVLGARCDPRLARQAQMLLDVASKLDGKGKGLADGVTIQMDWPVFTLRRVDGVLMLHEPDFSSPSGGLRADVTFSIQTVIR